MRGRRAAVAELILGFAPAPRSANANVITLLDVGGDPTDFTALAAGESAGLAFTLETGFSDVVITPDVFCLECSGRFVLMRDRVGSDAQLSDLVFASVYGGGQADPIALPTPLDMATYFLILVLDSGTAGWLGSADADIFEAPGVAAGISLFADAGNTDTTFPGATNFSAVFGLDHFVHITGAGDIVAVAAPPTAWLLIGGLSLLALRRRPATH
jgi:hypothetical protein